jgi:signal peptidase I
MHAKRLLHFGKEFYLIDAEAGLKKEHSFEVRISSNEGETTWGVNGGKVLALSTPSEFFLYEKSDVSQPSKSAKVSRYFSRSLSLILVTASLAVMGALASHLVDARVVLTGSMAPAIKPGDVVVAVSPQRKAPKIGDVVVYTGRRFDGTKVADFSHRIIAGDGKSGFTVKGDHNSTPDVQKPTIKDISGVVLFTIPFVGRILNPQALLLLLILGFGIWLIVDAFREE